MTSVIGKYIASKVFKETVANKFGQEDPYFERVPATRLDGRPSKKGKKRRKAAPPGLSDNDIRVLTKVKRRAYRLDMSLFNCCGIRFGWGSVIGIVPGFGDVLDCLMAVMVVRSCRNIDGGLPTSLYQRMMLNIVIDFVIGLIPFAGDIADAVYKANTRNAVILETYLRQRGEKNVKKQGLAVIEDPSLPDQFDRHIANESADSLPHHNHSPSMRETDQVPVARLHNEPTVPPAAAQKSGKGRFSFGGGGSKRSKTTDLERGPDPVATPARSSSKLKKETSTRR